MAGSLILVDILLHLLGLLFALTYWSWDSRVICLVLVDTAQVQAGRLSIPRDLNVTSCFTTYYGQWLLKIFQTSKVNLTHVQTSTPKVRERLVEWIQANAYATSLRKANCIGYLYFNLYTVSILVWYPFYLFLYSDDAPSIDGA